MDINGVSIGLLIAGAVLILFGRFFTALNSATQSILRRESYSSRERKTSTIYTVITGVAFCVLGLLELLDII